MQINGSWAEVMVDENSLRQALELPLCDVLNSGTCQGYAHNETAGPCFEDVDCRVSSE